MFLPVFVCPSVSKIT